MFRTWLPVVFAALAIDPAYAAEFRVSNAAELTLANSRLRPGDVVILADGKWENQKLLFRGAGTEAKPITYRAQTPGKVLMIGQSSIEVDGEYVVVSGIEMKDCTGDGDGIAIKGTNCRVTDCAVSASSFKVFAHLLGTRNRVDHCYFAGKTTESPTLQVECAKEPNWHRIDHNHFGPRPPLGRNGGETIRVGYSHQSMNESRATVEENLFEQCDGELEIISNKSCDNVYRANTFLDCAGTLTLRHGNRCRVEGNFFVGHHKQGSGGIRVIGEGHVVVNNYMESLEEEAFRITAGIPDSPLKGYFQARDCVIAFNTIAGSKGHCLDVAAGLGTSGRVLPPEGITVANNLFVLEGEFPPTKGTEEKGFRWAGNVMNRAPGEWAHPGFRIVEVTMQRSADGLLRPASKEVIRGVADLGAARVDLDMDGQLRSGAVDVGCDQTSAEPVTSKPLTPRDVGPAWSRPGIAKPQLGIGATP